MARVNITLVENSEACKQAKQLRETLRGLGNTKYSLKDVLLDGFVKKDTLVNIAGFFNDNLDVAANVFSTGLVALESIESKDDMVIAINNGGEIVEGASAHFFEASWGWIAQMYGLKIFNTPEDHQPIFQNPEATETTWMLIHSRIKLALQELAKRDPDFDLGHFELPVENYRKVLRNVPSKFLTEIEMGMLCRVYNRRGGMLETDVLLDTLNDVYVLTGEPEIVLTKQIVAYVDAICEGWQDPHEMIDVLKPLFSNSMNKESVREFVKMAVEQWLESKSGAFKFIYRAQVLDLKAKLF